MTPRAFNLFDALLVAGYAALFWQVISNTGVTVIGLASTEDTYYVVANLHMAVGVIIAALLPVALHYLMLRRASRRWVSAAGYICLFAGLLGAWLWAFPHVIPGLAMPRRYIDYLAFANRLALASFTGMALLLTASAASLTLTVFECVHRLKAT
ncbi:hypothetical protein V8J82_02915 [Gymnodinialimonas sp. 2305UL16-5]|uniref:hypothetical protein n=1 Tax=Gymnodinialimonas mytili TaxID=3126503 RepID=UPI003098A736